ncbi:hypothetical protein E2C01_055962 [Portunus trituberculatus]|uniref:Uncharacterized protein n=1 Tax=Portunus trituberculatus TaxID=210409 RepID=A0A5B7GWY9_PORTR|nr:hypothetical protein [Portunus trituberculatus]
MHVIAKVLFHEKARDDQVLCYAPTLDNETRHVDSALRAYRALRTCPASAACSSPQCTTPELIIRVGILHTAQSFMSPRAVYWLGKTVTGWADFILRNPMLFSRCSVVGSLVATCVEPGSCFCVKSALK